MAKIFDFFSPSSNKKDKGPTKNDFKEDKKFGTMYLFKLLKINFNKLTGVNLVYVLVILPFLFLFVSNMFDLDGTVSTPQNAFYPLVYGVAGYEPVAPTVISLSALWGGGTSLGVEGTLTNVFFYLGFTVLLTFGFANTGLAYILRNMVKRKPVFVWSDFFKCIKKNLKQALIIGILDGGVIALFAYDLMVYRANDSEFMYNIFFFVILMFTIIYFMMRFYLYLIMITFDLPIRKIIKNSFIFSMLGIKRNLVATIGIAVVVFLTYTIMSILPTLGIVIPFIWTISVSSFIGVYCAYPVMHKYMIAPYYKEDEKTGPEAVFTDRG